MKELNSKNYVDTMKLKIMKKIFTKQYFFLNSNPALIHDTFAITSHDLVKTLEELNIDNNIEFIMESAKDGKLAFLGCLISINENRELRTEVCRKPTHTGQYIHFFQISLYM